MLDFTLLKTPTPKTKDYVASAAQLGLPFTERLVEKRCTPKLEPSAVRSGRADANRDLVALEHDGPLFRVAPDFLHEAMRVTSDASDSRWPDVRNAERVER